MNIDSIDNIVNTVLKPLNEKGYNTLIGNQDATLKSIESQLRSYIVASNELEPHDHLKGLIDDGKSQENKFQLKTYDNKDGDKISYTFQCIDKESGISLKSLDVSINNQSISIPISGIIPSPGIAHELHQFKFPKLHTRNKQQDIQPNNSQRKHKL